MNSEVYAEVEKLRKHLEKTGNENEIDFLRWDTQGVLRLTTDDLVLRKEDFAAVSEFDFSAAEDENKFTIFFIFENCFLIRDNNAK